MPNVKLFGLNLRDIVVTPGKLKLDADPIVPSSSSNDKPPKDTKNVTFRSEKRFNRWRLSKYTSTSNISGGDERRHLIDQHARRLSAQPVAEGKAKDSDIFRKRDWTPDVNRMGYRRRKALSSVGFGHPVATASESR